MLDLVLRGGTIVDGSGLPRYRGDVGIQGGKIVAVGRPLADGRRTIDANGKVVAPGFVDPHTHYDAQLCFDPYAFPAIEHGITTVVTGNCSLSLAPLRVPQRERFSRMFRLIEEMPEAAFAQGVDWRWGEGFDGMVEALQRDIALNVAPLVGHSTLRLFVLGDDARRPATDHEIVAMSEALRACLEAGAVGLSTSYIDVDDDMIPVPSRWAEHRELEALCAVLGEKGRVLQVVHEFFDPGLTVSRIEVLGELSRRYGIVTTLSPLFHSDAMPGATGQVLEAVEREWADGARVWPQVQTRPVDISWTLEQRSLMFLVMPGWWSVASLPTKAEKLAAFTDPATREQLVGGVASLAAERGGTFDPATFVVRDVRDDGHRGLVGRTLGDIAAERGTTPAEAFIDLSVEDDLGMWFIRSEISHQNPDIVGELLAHPFVHVGASDGGAHVGSFATYGDTGYLLSRYVRETGALRLEDAVKKITADPCAIWGLPNRGLLREGYAADVVVFDPDTVDRGPEVGSEDFPGGGLRWVRRQVGVDTVVVNGAVTWTAGGGYDPAARAGTIAT